MSSTLDSAIFALNPIVTQMDMMDGKWGLDSFNLTEANTIGELVSNMMNLHECSRQVTFYFIITFYSF
jgi:hypothetical protein